MIDVHDGDLVVGVVDAIAKAVLAAVRSPQALKRRAQRGPNGAGADERAHSVDGGRSRFGDPGTGARVIARMARACWPESKK